MIQGLHISRAVYVAAEAPAFPICWPTGRAPRRNWLSLPRRTLLPLPASAKLWAVLNLLREQPSGHFAHAASERLRTGVPVLLRYWALLTDN